MEYSFPLYPAAPAKKSRNGLVWYAALLPLLGLLLENFAINRYLGMLVWAIAIIMRPLACLFDRRYLEKEEGLEPPPAGLCLFPTVYILKRAKLNRGENSIAVICAIALFIGIVANGFVRSVKITDSDILDAVKETSLASFEGLEDSDLNMSIEQAAKDNFQKYDYEIERDGNRRTVTLTGLRRDGHKYKIEFIVSHDGFTYTETKLGTVTKNGVAIDDDDRKKVLKEIFGEDTDSSSSDETSSEV